MIFFVLDQVAGAEYVLPFLLGPDQAASFCRLFASPVSARTLADHGIAAEVVTTVEPAAVAAWFECHAPTACILSASGNSALERAFLREARQRRVTTIQFIDTWVNYRRRFDCHGEVLFPDRILTLDHQARTAMIAEGIPAAIITILGQPYFEFSVLHRPAATAGSRLLLLTQPISHHYGQTLGYDETDFVTGAVTAARAAGIAPAGIDLQIHPAEEDAQYRRLLDGLAAGAGDRVGIRRGGGVDGYGVVLGMFSSLLVHAVLRRLPASSFQPAARGADHCFLSAAGYLPRLTSIPALSAFLRDPTPGAGWQELDAVIKGSMARFARLVLDIHDNPSTTNPRCQ